MANTFTTQKHSNRNSLLELIKLAFAFMVLKGHGFTPLAVTIPNAPNCQWFGSAGIAVEFFFCVAGWFLIRGIVSNQEKYGHLGLWRSWWKLFIKKISMYAIPCLIPGIAVCIITTFFDGGSPNGILWMYYFVHEIILVTFVYYIIFYKIKDEYKRFLANLWLCIIGLIVRFGIKALMITNVANLETLLEFWRALAFMSLGALWARIPKIKAKIGWLWLICILSIAVGITLVTLPINDIWKEVGFVVAYPFLIYGCLLVNFSFKPFNYLGQISKGLYLWQMVPWMFNVIGLSRGVVFFTNKWFLMGIAIGLPVLEDAIRRIVKAVKAKSFDENVYKAKLQRKQEKLYHVYKFDKKCFVLFILTACALISAALAYGVYGLSIGGFKNFDWFVKEGKITYNCAAILTLLWLTLFPVQLAINWKFQHNGIMRDEKQWKKN